MGGTMLFDLNPKHKREDLYNFDSEYNQLLDYLGSQHRSPIISIFGHRRTGKTSLLRTVLNETKYPYFVIDVRDFFHETNVKKKQFLRRLEKDLNQIRAEQEDWFKKIRDFFKNIQWFELHKKPPWIQFRWEKGVENFDILEIFSTLDELAMENDTVFVFAIDEAQELKKIRGIDMAEMIAHIFDYQDHTQMIVTGSQMRLLDNFLQQSDPDAPMFGRGVKKIETRKLEKEKSIDFLEKGFAQTSLNPSRDVLEFAVEQLDGVIGWLTLLGNYSADQGTIDKETIEDAAEKGSSIMAREFGNFLSFRQEAEERYTKTLETVMRLENATWTEVKEILESTLNQEIPDSRYSNLLKNLVRYGFLEKDQKQYRITDPMLEKAIKDNRI